MDGTPPQPEPSHQSGEAVPRSCRRLGAVDTETQYRVASEFHREALAGQNIPVSAGSFIACAVWTNLPAARGAAVAELVRPPTPATGWLSRTEFRTGAGRPTVLELVSVFAVDASPVGRPDAAEDHAAHRAAALRSIGQADRRLAASEQAQADILIRPHGLSGNDGVIDLGACARLLDRLEPLRLPDEGRGLAPATRRIHTFAGRRPEGPLGILVRLERGAPGRFVSTLVRSVVRDEGAGRRPMAVCSTLYRYAGEDWRAANA